ncbi:MAG: hypothetical protein Q8N69_00245 [bacterium]|nr:hypothetical protein [bacterium]
MRILPSITTTKGSDWRAKIKEADELGIKEVCFFLTCLDLEERKEFYELVGNSKIKSSPFIHIRNDLKEWELDFLIEKYRTKVFNIHCNVEYPLINDYYFKKYKDRIFIENIYSPLNEEELKIFGGICLDFTHLENDRLMNPEKYKHNLEILDKFKIGCNHISAIKKDLHEDAYGKEYRYDMHSFEDLSEFDYLKNYPKKYFSDFVALELENSLADQLRAKEYIIGFF